MLKWRIQASKVEKKMFQYPYDWISAMLKVFKDKNIYTQISVRAANKLNCMVLY
jgi:hypothetical protein